MLQLVINANPPNTVDLSSRVCFIKYYEKRMSPLHIVNAEEDLQRALAAMPAETQNTTYCLVTGVKRNIRRKPAAPEIKDESWPIFFWRVPL